MTQSDSPPKTAQLTAVALAALVLASALAVPGALVAPASASQSATISATPNTAGSDSVHHVTATVEANDNSTSLGEVEVDYSVGSNPADISNVGQNSVQEAYVVDADTGNRTNVTDDLSSVSASNNGETLHIEFGGSHTIHQNDTVHVVYSDVQNPGDAGTFDVDVAINTQSTDNPTTTKLNVDPNPGNLDVTIEDDREGAYSIHTARYTPSSAVDNTSLTNLSFDYGDDFSGTVIDAYAAWVDTDQNGQYNESVDRTLNVTSADADNGELDLGFDGNDTLATNETVVVEYGIENPSQPGDYSVSASVNNGATTASDSYTVVDAPDRSVWVDAEPEYVGASSTYTVSIYDLDNADIGDSLNSIEVDYSAGANASDISNVGREDIETVYIERDTEDGWERIDVTDDLSEVDGSNNGETLTLGFGGSYDLKAGDDIVVQYSDVQNPDSEGFTAVEVGVNVQSSDDPATDDLYIRKAHLAAMVGPCPCDAENELDGATNASWMTAVSPGHQTHGDSLSTITVDFGATDEYTQQFDGDISAVGADDVTMAVVPSGGYDDRSQWQNLTVESVEASGQELTFTFAGDYTLNRTEVIYLKFHDVENPDDGGWYVANVTLNGENTATTYPYDIVTNTTVTDATVTPDDDTKNTTTGYSLSATVDPEDGSDQVNNIEFEFETTVTEDATVESVAIEHADGSTTTLAEDDYDAYTWYDEVSIDVDEDASYTLNKGDTVTVELSGAQTPAETGEYAVEAEVNEGSWRIDSEAVAKYSVTTADTGGNTGGNTGGSNDDTSDSTNSGSVDVNTETATPTATPTATATPTPTETATATPTEAVTATEAAEQENSPTAQNSGTEAATTSTDTPGLTLVTALLALALAALLARRKR